MNLWEKITIDDDVLIITSGTHINIEQFFRTLNSTESLKVSLPVRRFGYENLTHRTSHCESYWWTECLKALTGPHIHLMHSTPRRWFTAVRFTAEWMQCSNALQMQEFELCMEVQRKSYNFTRFRSNNTTRRPVSTSLKSKSFLATDFYGMKRTEFCGTEIY